MLDTPSTVVFRDEYFKIVGISETLDGFETGGGEAYTSQMNLVNISTAFGRPGPVKLLIESGHSMEGCG